MKRQQYSLQPNWSKIKLPPVQQRFFYSADCNPFEEMVAKHLRDKLNAQDFYLFNNLILPSSHNGSSEIDHVVVSRSGVFVIESKDWGGWLFGDRISRCWTLSLSKGPGKRATKQAVLNPWRQNYSHIKTLKEQLPFLDKVFYNVVVLSDRGEFKTERPGGILYLSELAQYITNKEETLLTRGEFTMTIGRLAYLHQAAGIKLVEHVNNIKTYLETGAAKN